MELKKRIRKKKVTNCYSINSQSVHHAEYLASPYDSFEGNSNDTFVSAKEINDIKTEKQLLSLKKNHINSIGKPKI